MPPAKKHHAPVVEPDNISQKPSGPADDPVVDAIADANALLYRDRSGPARQAGSTEGANYSGTTARFAREAAGVTHDAVPEES